MTNLDKKEVPEKDTHPGEYLLWFVEEAIFDPKYQDWTGGRMEVHTYEDEYAISEKRFFTPRSEEWIEFSKKYDGAWVVKATLDEVTATIKSKFYHQVD